MPIMDRRRRPGSEQIPRYATGYCTTNCAGRHSLLRSHDELGSTLNASALDQEEDEELAHPWIDGLGELVLELHKLTPRFLECCGLNGFAPLCLMPAPAPCRHSCDMRFAGEGLIEGPAPSHCCSS